MEKEIYDLILLFNSQKTKAKNLEKSFIEILQKNNILFLKLYKMKSSRFVYVFFHNTETVTFLHCDYCKVLYSSFLPGFSIPLQSKT